MYFMARRSLSGVPWVLREVPRSLGGFLFKDVGGHVWGAEVRSFVEFPLFSVSRMLLQTDELKARSPELGVKVALDPF